MLSGMSSHKEDERWMQLALDLAQPGREQGEVPVGAVVVRDGVLLGSGSNQPVSRHDPSAHAEIVALRAAGLAESNYRLPTAVSLYRQAGRFRAAPVPHPYRQGAL